MHAGAHRNHRYVGVCGEAPATYPDIAAFLTRLGIHSISVNADGVLRTMKVAHDAEHTVRLKQVI